MNLQRIAEAAKIIRQGGVVAYPTEAVFGLGCDPEEQTAVKRLLKLKHRSADKGLILIAAELPQLDPFIAPLSDKLRKQLLSTWPGPVTWVLPAAPYVSPLLRGKYSTIAVRVTAHPIAARLCRYARTAIVSTSANISGREPARSIEHVATEFGGQIDCILEGPVDPTGTPTEIRDGESGRIIRAGN
jgi:L-threonylcarbamoyladenylate synthase